MDNILITGGAGFIGSHVVEKIVADYPKASITILDKMTYAADFENIAHIVDRDKRRLVVGDVCDFELCSSLMHDIDCVIHTAAESHVDNSFGNSLAFTRSNTLGTHTLLEAARINSVKLFVHVSTDEVYGEIDNGVFTEESHLCPSNPYSGSKAAADMIVNSYLHSFDLPVLMVRSNNIVGIRQYPEKIIPKFSMQAMCDRQMTLHGNGMNRRRYLAVEDFSEAIVVLIQKGKVGEIYNVGTQDEYSNLDIAKMICDAFDKDTNKDICFVQDRPFNDSRYAVQFDKIAALGWRPTRHLPDEIPNITNWYRDHIKRYLHLFQ